MIGGVVTWLLTSRVGRATALVAGLALAVGVALLRAFSAGKSAERTKQDQQSLQNLRKRQETDAEVESLGHADLDRRMHRWVRDDK